MWGIETVSVYCECYPKPSEVSELLSEAVTATGPKYLPINYLKWTKCLNAGLLYAQINTRMSCCNTYSQSQPEKVI